VRDGRFSARVLQTVDAAYRFVGGLRGVDEVDLRTPIVLTHDVSPSVQRESAVFAALDFTLSTAGGGAPSYGTFEIDDLFDTSGGFKERLAQAGRNRDNTDVWLCQVGAMISDANAGFLSSCALGFSTPNRGNVYNPGQSSASPEFLAYYGDFVPASSILVSGGARTISAASSGVNVKSTTRTTVVLPALVEDLNYTVTDNGTGAAPVTFRTRLACMPKGSPNPGTW